MDMTGARAYHIRVMTASPASLLLELEAPDLLPVGSPPPRGAGYGVLPAAQADRPGFQGPGKLSYTHEDCVEFIIQNPAVTQKELAQRYGYTEVWISRIVACDAFQAAVAARRKEVLSPELLATAEENFKALVLRSQNYLLEQLNGPKATPQLALGVLATASRALGYGARDTNITLNQSFVVELPAAALSSEVWSKGRTLEHAPTPQRAAERTMPLPAAIPAGASLPSAQIDAVEKVGA